MPEIRKLLQEAKLNSEMFFFCYNTKQMKQYGHFKRERGLANSKSIEPVFLCWKGLVPRCVAKHRVYVDAGSTTFHQIMKSVPILPPKQQAYVSSDVRDKSLATMIGVASTED